MGVPPPIAGVVLAGGRSRRMGGRDKSFALFHGKHLVAHAVTRFRPQVGMLAVNSNGDAAALAGLAVPVIADTIPGRPGPLAGILAGMQWAKAEGAGQVATVAVDAPLFPTDLVARLAAGDGGGTVAVARSGGRIHPVFGLFPVGLAGDLAEFIARGESLRVTDWLARHAIVAVDFDEAAAGELDPFLNINTPAELAAAERNAALPPA
jgi:molybdopterin-guanine dinucleotide biosynthesis protein A